MLYTQRYVQVAHCYKFSEWNKKYDFKYQKPYNTIIEKHLDCESSLFTGILEIILFKAILWNKWFVYCINPNFHILDFLKEKYMKNRRKLFAIILYDEKLFS